MDALPEDAAQRVQATPEYAALRGALDVLRAQLAQAHADLDALYALRAAADADPVALARRLVADEPPLALPGAQAVAAVPDVPLARYRRRLGRRGPTRYEQNLSFLIGRIAEVQGRRPGARPLPETQSCPASPARALSPGAVRRMFGAIVAEGRGRAASVLPEARPGVRPPPRAASVPASAPLAGRVSLRHARRESSVPDAAGAVPVRPTHAATPWSAAERARLDELLASVPAERVAVRRYAKIAAALGTRTTSQVASRVQKMLRRAREASRSPADGHVSPASSSSSSSGEAASPPE